MTRRGRAARLREVGPPDAPQNHPDPQAAIGWDDLTPPEQAALMRINRGHGLDEPAGERLVRLGLAVLRPSGIGISRAGRELVIARLLREGGTAKG